MATFGTMKILKGATVLGFALTAAAVATTAGAQTATARPEMPSTTAPVVAQTPRAAPAPAAGGAVSGQTPKPTTPATVAPASAPMKHSEAAWPQGFSVVLVLGDLQAASASDDVPPAARKALVDMRDFLPFKSYKLLDAAWLMCCGADPRTPFGGGRSGLINSELGAVSQILRGPDDQEYELRLSTSRTENARVFVRFALANSRMATDAPDETNAANSRASAEVVEMMNKRAQMEREIAAKRAASGGADNDDLLRMKAELQNLTRQIVELETRSRRPDGPPRSSAQAGTRSMSGRSIIDTSFTMDVGETVVVGTSRLRGGSRALIALLTAVPPRNPHRE